MMTVAVLFARADSNYKNIPGCDVYDMARNALTWLGGSPCIAHPPCRAWGRLRTFSRPAAGEKYLAVWSVAQVRTWGGVLEHPSTSLLWAHCGLPLPGAGYDGFGGFSICIHQHWFGHKCEKATWLYIVGVRKQALPVMPMVLGEASHVLETKKKIKDRPRLPKKEREHTPPDLCRWLIELAASTVQPAKEKDDDGKK